MLLVVASLVASALGADPAAAEAEIGLLRADALEWVESGRWNEALDAGDKLLAACRREHGLEHAETARADILLGEIRQALEEPLLAEAHFRRALAVQEKVFSKHEPTLVLALTHLAAALKAQKRFAEATPLLQRTLEIQRELSGPDHEDTAVSTRNVALLLRLQGDFDQALPLYEEVLRIRRKTLGAAQRDTLGSVRELVDLHERRGDPAAADQCAAEGVAAIEKEAGPDSAVLPVALGEWGAIAERQGRYAEAEPRYRRALEIQEKRNQPRDPELAASLTALGVCLRQLDRLGEAERLLLRALDIQAESADTRPADFAEGCRQLAWLRQMGGDFDGALPLFDRALAMRERAFGPNSDETIESLAELAGLQLQRGVFEKGEALLTTRRERIEARFGAKSMEAAEAWRDVATFCEAAKHWPAAQDAATRSLQLYENQFGLGDPHTMDALYFLARICAASGDAKLAREQYARLKPWFDEHPEADAKGRAEWMRQSAIATLRAGEVKDAERLFVESRKWHEAKLGPNDPATLRSLGDLWTFYDESKQGDRALDTARELAARSTQALGADAPATLLISERLAQLCATQGERAEGAKWFRRALDGARKCYGEDAPEALDALRRLAAWHEAGREFASAEPLRRERLVAIQRLAGKESDAAAAAREELDACLKKRPIFR